MIEWKDADCAPDHGGYLWVKTAKGRVFMAYQWGISDGENESRTWYEVNEGDAPDCWTDGICWSSNEDQEPSDPVTHWSEI